MRFSRQRATVLKVLQGTESHPTVEWIYGQVRQDIPNISLGTVYRNLNQLADGGSIQRIYDNGHVRYDGNMDRHDHIRCIHCQRIFDVHLPLEEITKSIPQDYGFNVTGYALDIQGECHECQSNRTEK